MARGRVDLPLHLGWRGLRANQELLDQPHPLAVQIGLVQREVGCEVAPGRGRTSEVEGDLDGMDVGRAECRVEGNRAIEGLQDLLRRRAPDQRPVHPRIPELVPRLGVVGIATHGFAERREQPRVVLPPSGIGGSI